MRCFGGDGTLRENPAGDVLASLTTMVWNAPPKSWTGGAAMADASLNRGMTVRFADAVAFAQIGIVGLDGRSSWRRCASTGCRRWRRPCSAARPRCRSGSASSPSRPPRPAVAGRRRRAPGRRRGPGARQGDRAEASLASSTRFIELDAFARTNNTVRVLARNVSGAAFDLGAATLSVAVTERQIP